MLVFQTKCKGSTPFYRTTLRYEQQLKKIHLLNEKKVYLVFWTWKRLGHRAHCLCVQEGSIPFMSANLLNKRQIAP
jgi:hypothetical protein